MKTVPAEEFCKAALNNELTELDRLPEGLALTEDFVFSRPAERELKLDVYDLEQPPDEPRPAILFIHGGGWQRGSKKQFARQAAYLTSRYAFLSVCCEYRLSSEAKFPACLHDVKCAVRWIRSVTDERNVDPERVACAGGSAGGHLAAMLATTAGIEEYEGDTGFNDCLSHVNLCIPHNPALDLLSLGWRRALPGGRDTLRKLLGGDPADIPDIYHGASPFYRAHAETPPMLLLHGSQDTTIECEQSVAMHERLLRLGVPCEMEIYDGRGHGWFNHPPDFAVVLRRLEDFLVEFFELDKA